MSENEFANHPTVIKRPPSAPNWTPAEIRALACAMFASGFGFAVIAMVALSMVIR
jgi:hypothetical protein